MPSEAERQEIRRALKAVSSSGAATEAVRLTRELLSFGKAADVMFCASIFNSIREVLTLEAGCRALKIFIARSVTMEPIAPFLFVRSVLAGFVLDLHIGGYGSFMDEMLNPESALGLANADLVFLLLDLEDVAGRLPDLCSDGLGDGVLQEIEESVLRLSQMLRAYRSSHLGHVVLQGFVVPDETSLGDVGTANLPFSLPNAVRVLNRRLAELCREIAGCVFFDVDQCAARFGKTHWSDPRLFLASRLPVAQVAFDVYAQALVRTMSALFKAPRKVLCTDLDNTFWGGVLGEDGPMGIATGSAFPGNCYLRYQSFLKQLSKRGILLAIVSKNNVEDVTEAFALRSADLALTLDDFVGRKISWHEKADALRELAAELSLGLSSFVFVDDNPVECEAIRRCMPEVAVVEIPPDEPWKITAMLAQEAFFDAISVTAEDVGRVKEYKAQMERASWSKSAVNQQEFLKSLEIVCTFVSAVDAPLARSVQLLEKTNQFNLTTRRYSSAEVERLAAAPGGLALAVRVRDRFGDAGVVGLALAKQTGDQCIIINLLLSCRVIGRGIETAILARIAEDALRLGSRWLIGEYIPTRKNSPCAEFYPYHGFEREDGPEHASSIYRLDLSQHVPVSPSWLSLEGDLSYARASAVLAS